MEGGPVADCVRVWVDNDAGASVRRQSWVAKGYHIESADAHDNTALAESCVKGHLHVIEYLLAQVRRRCRARAGGARAGARTASRVAF